MYRLSLWQDELENNLETMITPLASSEVKAPNRAYNLILKRNINGQKSLSFEIFMKYYDIDSNKLIDNPLASFICNEKRLKLYYNDNWYDFIIKSVEENSDKYTMTVNATDLFINELSRNGFEIELNQKLFNNQGTAAELGEKVLQGTDWSINLDECDTLIQTNEEVCYECTLESSIEDVQSMLDKNKTFTVSKFYLPYSCVINNENPAQIIVIDDNLIYGTDDGVALYSDHNCLVEIIDNKINGVSFEKKISNSHRVEKILESPIIWYDDRLESVVTLYEGVFEGEKTQQFYCYEDNQVIAPTINQNWIVNNKDFSSESGWTGAKRIYTPNLKTAETADEILSNIQSLSSTLSASEDAPSMMGIFKCMYNNGLFYYRDNIGELKKGDKLICRIIGENYGTPGIGMKNNGSIMLYGSSTEKVENGTYIITIEKNISFDMLRTNNYIFMLYWAQTQTFGYIKEIQLYRYNETDVIYNLIESVPLSTYDSSTYSLITHNKRDSSNPFPYHSYNLISNKDKIKISFDLNIATGTFNGQFHLFMKNPSSSSTLQGLSCPVNITENGTYTYEFNINTDDAFSTNDIDIGFTPNEAFVGTISNIKIFFKEKIVPIQIDTFFEPTIETTYLFYDINSIFKNKEDFLSVVKYQYKELPSSITKYNNNYQKVKSITAKESNRLNIIQSICESFECWADIQITRDNIGRVLKKQIAFKKYIEKNNYAGIRRGINLKSTIRKIESNTLTTKMIVKNNSNEFAKNNFCSISRSEENPTRQNVLYDFDYYINQQILDKNTVISLLYGNQKNKGYFNQWHDYGVREQKLSEEYSVLAIQYDKAKSLVDINNAAIESARNQIDDNNADLRDYMGNSYEYYISENGKQDLFDNRNNSLFISYMTKIKNLKNILNENIKQLSTNQNNKDNLDNLLTSKLNELETIRYDKNNLDNDFYKKFSRFLQEGSWISEDYIDDTEYYLNAANVLHTSAFPKISYTFAIIDISNIEGYNFYEYQPGDKTWVQDTEFFGWTDKLKKNPVREEVVISEINSNLDDKSKDTITVQNYKTQFEDLFQRITAATQTIELNKGAYNRAVIASTNKM